MFNIVTLQQFSFIIGIFFLFLFYKNSQSRTNFLRILHIWAGRIASGLILVGMTFSLFIPRHVMNEQLQSQVISCRQTNTKLAREKEQIAQKIQQFQAQINALQQDKSKIETENARLVKLKNCEDSQADEQQLQEQINALQQAKNEFEVENARLLEEKRQRTEQVKQLEVQLTSSKEALSKLKDENIRIVEENNQFKKKHIKPICDELRLVLPQNRKFFYTGQCDKSHKKPDGIGLMYNELREIYVVEFAKDQPKPIVLFQY